MNNTTPVVNHGQVIYTYPITRFKKTDDINLIHKVHFFCGKRMFENVGMALWSRLRNNPSRISAAAMLQG
ncbi:hypothetical protein [Alkaliphilus hydrothermalis]|uniref:hypothetical protein n=1 Tax=Alkaliphilus hydrothermalis TaxID=1482730 RepID=UPI0038CBFE9A